MRMGRHPNQTSMGADYMLSIQRLSAMQIGGYSRRAAVQR
jgi:hypothetical protein